MGFGRYRSLCRNAPAPEYRIRCRFGDGRTIQLALGNREHVSLISVDLPEPETPVMQVNNPPAASASRPSGCCRVRLSAQHFFRIRRNAFLRHFNLAFALMYCPVNDSGTAIIASSGPLRPLHRREHLRPGQCRSHGQGANCVFVVLHHNHGITEIAQWISVPNRRSLSRWCRPIDGCPART